MSRKPTLPSSPTHSFFAVLRMLVLLLLLPAGQTLVHGQTSTAAGFRYTHTTDSSDWVQLTRPTMVEPPFVNTDFKFIFRNNYYYLMADSANGIFRIVSDQALSDQSYATVCHLMMYQIFDTTPYHPPVGINSMKMQVFGAEGSRTMVLECELRHTSADVLLCKYQLQLGESDGSIRVVCSPSASIQSIRVALELRNGYDITYANVVADTLRASASPEPFAPNTAWRNDLFVPEAPQCPHTLDGLHAETVTQTSARIRWRPYFLDTRYELEYGPLDTSLGQSRRIATRESEMLLPDLLPGVKYYARLTASCPSNDRAGLCQFKTYCDSPHGNTIYFANLYDSNVVCRIGRTYAPDWVRQVADYGSTSIASRHTVHSGMSETDGRTGGRLRVIPDGHCMSVRLGNHQGGAQQESVTYHLHIDTNEYDLLILRYAVVEENPNHSLEGQPKFFFGINDSAGQPISSCYTADFVSGYAGGWNEYQRLGYSSVLWRDWQAVGVDLAPLHGQNIQVKLSNCDCAAGGHYGYAYYTLESARKTFETKVCGHAASNVYYAPAGFGYRWYRADNPEVTLSNADSLLVDAPGRYCCRVSYTLSDSVCGFTISTTVADRYPAARFQSRALNSCGSVVQFENHSRVASDAARTVLTNESCTQYLWRFGDGATSEAANPVHTFSDGTYTVELVAMLSDGSCRDSVRQTIQVNLVTDTLRDTICPGSARYFYDRFVSDSGRYAYIEDCRKHILDLSLHPVSESERYDTICAGGQFLLAGNIFFSEGRHRCVMTGHPDAHQCDSVCWINLAVRPLNYLQITDTIPLGDSLFFRGTNYGSPSVRQIRLYGAGDECDSIVTLRLACIEQHDSTVCVSALPLVWDGITFTREGADTATLTSSVRADSLVVRNLTVQYPVHEWVRFDTICEGDSVAIDDTVFYTEGRHLYELLDTLRCDSAKWVSLTVWPRVLNHYADTLPVGDSIRFGDTIYHAPARYEAALVSTHGCDSLVSLRLSCLDQRDSAVCVSALPVTWDGLVFSQAGSDTLSLLSAVNTDSLIVHNLAVRTPPAVEPQVTPHCDNPAYYDVRLPGCCCYTWQSDPPDSVLLLSRPDSAARLSPEVQTRYRIIADYADAPSCPDTVELRLAKIQYPAAALYVSPAWLSPDQLEVQAWDQSRASASRQWYIDGVLQWEEGRVLRHTADAKADSVVLMLRVGNETCADSIAQVVPIYRFSLHFPNVFTPDAESNNRFGCHATNIGSYGLWVYDRRGVLVFHTSDQRQQWDGTCRGTACPQGAYNYRCQYSIPTAGMQTRAGTVLLLR